MQDVQYKDELVALEPQMRTMVRRFRKHGYNFEGYDEDDLVQCLFVKALQVQGECKPDTPVCRLKYWLYTVFKRHLVGLVKQTQRAACWLVYADEPYFTNIEVQVDTMAQAQRNVATGVVREFTAYLQDVDPHLASVCNAMLLCDGDHQQVAQQVGITVAEVGYALTKIRCCTKLNSLLSAVAF